MQPESPISWQDAASTYTPCLGGHRQAEQHMRRGSVVDATQRESTIMADPHLRAPPDAYGKPSH
jgi:hypothetical protein